MGGKRHENGMGINEGPRGSKIKIQDHGANLFGPKNRNGEESLENSPLPKERKGGAFINGNQPRMSLMSSCFLAYPTLTLIAWAICF